MKELEIYIHIPFCARKCNYCDFLSFPSGGMPQRAYVDRLKEEITKASVLFPEHEVTSVFIGGGTPSILEAELIGELMDCVRENYRMISDAEITIEVNPGSTLRHKFARYREAGVNRLSIGLQSADNGELRVLGRIHTFEEFLKCYQGARMEGFDNINVDLINCFPTQTAASWKKTLKNVLMLKPEHVSVYNLQLEEGTPFCDLVAGGDLSLPSEEEAAAMDAVTKELMTAYKFLRYEISNYAREGKECRHNKGYWTGKDYIGFGLGSSSYVNGTRFKNTTVFEDYLKTGFTELSWEEYVKGKQSVETLPEREKMREFMILGLRLTKGVGSIDFYRRFGLQLDDVYGNIIDRYTARGLLERDGYDVRLTERGMELANTVMSEF